MARLDLNLDAYRLTADILDRLRSLLRRHLHEAHGANWESDGIPPDPREFLLQRRARESSLKWHPSTGVDVLDFASFANLHDVIIAHPRLRDAFARLAPEPQALRLRFLELDSVLNRLAFARPVSESDMELLLGFDERLRLLAAELSAEQGARLQEAREAGTAAAPAQVRPHQAFESPGPEPAMQPSPAAAHRDSPANRPAPAAQSPAPRRAPEAPRAQPRPPSSETTVGTATRTAPADEAETPSLELDEALRRGDDRAVLTSLYYEITTIAERIWTDASAARAPVWEAVRESRWYRERFSPLRLRVVSDFYDLLRAVQERVAAGITRGDLHEFLKDHNFAQLLLDLREFFKPLQATARR